jgi:nitrogen fixation protein FixH
MGEIRGWHVAVFTSGCFAVIMAVNATLAWQAVATFPGLEVGNSYVASQRFEADRRAQTALGWTLAETYTSGTLRLSFTGPDGAPAPVAALRVLVGRSTEARDDTRPVMLAEGNAFVAPVALAPGKWLLRIEAEAADGTLFQQRRDLFVRG